MDTRTGEVMSASDAVKRLKEHPEDIQFVGEMKLPPTAKQANDKKIGLLDDCPCNSGRKFGECCNKYAVFGMNSQLMLVQGLKNLFTLLENDSRRKFTATGQKRSKHHLEVLHFVNKKLTELEVNLTDMGAGQPVAGVAELFKEAVPQPDGSVLYDEADESNISGKDSNNPAHDNGTVPWQPTIAPLRTSEVDEKGEGAGGVHGNQPQMESKSTE